MVDWVWNVGAMSPDLAHEQHSNRFTIHIDSFVE